MDFPVTAREWCCNILVFLNVLLRGVHTLFGAFEVDVKLLPIIVTALILTASRSEIVGGE